MLMNTSTNVQDLNIYIDDTPLDNVENIKYLGVHLKSNLSWDAHI